MTICKNNLALVNTAIFLGTFLIASSIHAQILKLPDKDVTVKTSANIPQRGQSSQTVRKTHGEAINKHAPVGNPPISIWEYPNFNVYFESEHVLHTVITP